MALRMGLQKFFVFADISTWLVLRIDICFVRTDSIIQSLHLCRFSVDPGPPPVSA
jgi:hypothetical protein